MRGLTRWIEEKTASLLGPDREQRIETLAKDIEKGLKNQREQFELKAALPDAVYTENDLNAAIDRVYQRKVAEVWGDGKLTKREQRTLRFIADKLGVGFTHAAELVKTQGIKEFGRRLAAALEDGEISERERSELETIASDLGLTFSELMRQYFQQEGEQFLRGIFASMVADGELTSKQWEMLLQTARTIGLNSDELSEAIREQINQFVEHVLADAKADGRLDTSERDTLAWLVDNVMPDGTYRAYVRDEIERLEKLTSIRDGDLPSTESPRDLSLKAGEIVHFHGNAKFLRIKHLKRETKREHFYGSIAITDDRMLFTSAEETFGVRHRKVVALRQQRNGTIELRATKKSQGWYTFDADPDLVFAIWQTAVAKTNQTVVENKDEAPKRHISRDVRQRVWQRYGGRCAECGDDRYLEFDHIIPVAKGGSNSDNNVQLLCRGCNMAKSDAI